MSNIWVTWGDVFNASLQDLWWGFIHFAPKLIIAIIFFIIGWVVGSLVSKALAQVIGALKIDKLLQSIGTEEVLAKAGMKLNVGLFIGEIVKWFIIIVFLIPSLNLVGLDQVSTFLGTDILGYLPRVIVAAFVLIVATVLAEALSKAVITGAKSMNVRSANMLGVISKYAVWTFAFIIALDKLGIAEFYMNILFAGIISMLALAGALAFGLGGKDAAARFIDKMKDDMSHR